MGFLEKARELADVEKSIYDLAWSGVSFLAPAPKKESLVPVLIPAAVAVAAFFVSGCVDPEGLVRIGCWLIGILAVGKTYMNWKQRSITNSSGQDRANASDRLTALTVKRDGLVKELKAMKPEGDKNTYWWETGVLPVETSRWRTKLDCSHWDFGIFNEISIEPKNGGLYCRDFINETTVCTRKQAKNLAKSSDFCEIYHDNSAWNGKSDKLLCRYLYAFTMDQLEEITSSTTRVRVDKEEEMKKYRNKLDEWERNLNWICHSSYSTDEERYYHREISEESYRQNQDDRWMLEYWQQKKLDKRPDYEEDTVYRQRFDDFYDFTFVPCAVILQSAEDGQTASVLLPRRIQESIEFTMRAENSSCPSCGYLESYLEFDPLIVGGTRIQPDIKMVADQLFNEKGKLGLSLKRRNILERKPEGLTDEEWSYLIWTDH